MYSNKFTDVLGVTITHHIIMIFVIAQTAGEKELFRAHVISNEPILQYIPSRGELVVTNVSIYTSMFY